jgi:hypothetical protein
MGAHGPRRARTAFCVAVGCRVACRWTSGMSVGTAARQVVARMAAGGMVRRVAAGSAVTPCVGARDIVPTDVD